jgi:hypothetical protein
MNLLYLSTLLVLSSSDLGISASESNLRTSGVISELCSTEERDLHVVADFCWKEAYGQGVGTIPDQCRRGRDTLVLLCCSKYPGRCTRFGVDCHQNCPSGFRDDVLLYRLVEYGRGVGYPWSFGDPLDKSGMISRCEADHGRGNCEMSGLIAYPKCKSGYSPFGCCICRPTPPNCRVIGMNGGIDLSCAKKIILGDPIRMSCASGKQYDADLCTSYREFGDIADDVCILLLVESCLSVHLLTNTIICFIVQVPEVRQPR